MKSFKENQFLFIATAVSVAFHAVALTVHFVAPAAFKVEPTDPGLEVILVNAKHASKPLKADALAQADLDGGGNADAGRAKSPLPNMGRMEDGDSIKASQRYIQEMEERQKNLLTQLNKSPVTAAPVTEKKQSEPNQTGTDLIETSKALARNVAEITQTIEDQNKRPRKTYLSPTTKGVGYAMYYKTFQRRVEDIGTLNFPQKNGKKLYGELVLNIPIFMDGSIYLKEGGIRVEKSSGNPALDEAAINIVRRSAPFGRFPPNMLSQDRDDLWVIITTFKFTREEKLEANLTGGYY
ncbi:energy transducer TonB [Pseudoduganella violaceinigra]|uniref:energy transducer TonB n=1 Tax=Pseudoduganella violaceinigra TaxID=246602 RepID=UPI0004208955|nr:TonB C-terminal domain-containing protein [Pseudoduganella violaceinigra]